MTDLLRTTVKAIPGAGGHISAPSRIVTKLDFGVHYIRVPYNYDSVSASPSNTTPAPQDQLSSYHSETEVGGIVRVFEPSMGRLWNGTSLNAQRLAEWQATIAYWTAKGMKVIWDAQMLEGSANDQLGNPMTSAAHLEECRDFVTAMAPHMATAGLYAFAPTNEPKAAADAGGWAASRDTALAQLQRITWTLMRQHAPNVIVCSPEFQGGEREQFAAFLGASAQGTVVNGSDGTGTVGAGVSNSPGSLYFHVVAWHPYCAGTTRAAVEAASSANARDIARSSMRACKAALWERILRSPSSPLFGQTMPDIWATEFNVCEATAAANTDFRFQALTSAEKDRLIRMALLGALAAGFKKVILYAVDHQNFTSGSVTGAADNGSGLIRITGTSGLVFEGDQVTLASVGGVPAANGTWSATYIDATHFDLQGSTFSGTYTSGGTIGRFRYNLGGWHTEFQTIVTELLAAGTLQAGFISDGSADSHRPWYQCGTSAIKAANSSGVFA